MIMYTQLCNVPLSSLYNIPLNLIRAIEEMYSGTKAKVVTPLVCYKGTRLNHFFL